MRKPGALTRKNSEKEILEEGKKNGSCDHYRTIRSGKTKAADWFEDKDYYCIDNMPPALIKNFIDLALSGNKKIKKAAFVIDIRGGEFLGGIKDIVGELERDEIWTSSCCTLKPLMKF